MALTMMLLAPCAIAAPTTPDVDNPPPPITINFRTGIYIPTFDGDASLGDTALSRALDFETVIDLDDRDAALNMELELTRNRWTARFSGFRAEADGAGTMPFAADFGDLSFAAGDAFESELSFTTVAFEMQYELHRPYDRAETGDVHLSFSPVFGLRWLDVDMELTDVAAGLTAAPEGEWLGAFIGGAASFSLDTPEVPLIERFDMDLAASFGPAFGGGGDSDGGTVAQIRGGLTFWMTESAFLEVGYRLVSFDVEADDDFEFDGSTQGLFFGGGVEF